MVSWCGTRFWRLYDLIKEWDLLRAIACLSIVTLHTTTWMTFHNEFYAEHTALHFIRILLCFATPTFIVLSIIILAHKYPNQLPPNFWSKRIRFLLVPYMAWAIIYAGIAETIYRKDLFFITVLQNFFRGDFVGWFVIVILQLYALYALLKKYQLADVVVLPLAICISLVHHALIQLPYPFFMTHQTQFRLLLTGWLGYFAIAYLAGKHYKKLAAALLRYRWWTLVTALLSAMLIFINMKLGQTGIHSRRLDLIPFVCSISALILAWGQKLPYFKIVRILSRYAFMIYLIHWQVLWFGSGFIMRFGLSFKVTIVIIVTLTVALCIAIAWTIARLPFGQYIVGAIKK